MFAESRGPVLSRVPEGSKYSYMQNTHVNRPPELNKPLVSAQNPMGDVEFPDPYEVARLLGHKGAQSPCNLEQGLMSEILDNAPRRPKVRLGAYRPGQLRR